MCFVLEEQVVYNVPQYFEAILLLKDQKISGLLLVFDSLTLAFDRLYNVL